MNQLIQWLLRFWHKNFGIHMKGISEFWNLEYRFWIAPGKKGSIFRKKVICILVKNVECSFSRIYYQPAFKLLQKVYFYFNQFQISEKSEYNKWTYCTIINTVSVSEIAIKRLEINKIAKAYRLWVIGNNRICSFLEFDMEIFKRADLWDWEI